MVAAVAAVSPLHNGALSPLVSPSFSSLNTSQAVSVETSMASVVTPIAQGWAWKQRDPSVVSVLDELTSSWKAATEFPSEVHVELLKAGNIPDPFLGFNEHEVQCE